CLSHDIFDPSSVACAYVRWAQSNPPDIGNTCSNALRVLESPTKLRAIQLSDEEKEKFRTDVEENVRNRNGNSLSNGSLMRQSVITAVYASNYFLASKKNNNAEEGSVGKGGKWYFSLCLLSFRLLSAVEADTLLTHSNPLAIEASKAFSLLLFNLIKGKTPEEALKSTLSIILSPDIHSLLESSRDHLISVILPNGQTSNGDDAHIGYLGVSLQIAVYYLLHAPSFSSGLLSVVGGDTDTNGCIAGALLGARFGQEGILLEWIHTVENAELRMKGENGI
ncbi:hypothetical protein PENTCL1PPCAC_26635, partial [Pristionchus entomophagus]